MGNEIKGTAAAVLKALGEATEATLAELDQELAAARNHVQSLEAVRKLVDIKLHGKKAAGPKKKAGPGAEPAGGPALGMWRRRQMAQVILARGAMTDKELSKHSNVPDHAVKSLSLGHAWFVRDEKGNLRLTERGRLEAVEDRDE